MTYPLALMPPLRGRSSTRDTGDPDRRPSTDLPPDSGGNRSGSDRRSRPRPSRLLPGFVPGGWKRNVVVGLSYLLGALAVLGVARFVIELL